MAIWDQIDEAKAVLDALPPLTNGSLIRLDEEFSLQFNYNSNRIEGSTLTCLLYTSSKIGMQTGKFCFW